MKCDFWTVVSIYFAGMNMGAALAAVIVKSIGC
jgi:hypothetical protein